MVEDLRAAVVSMEKKLNFLMEKMHTIDKKCKILIDTVHLHSDMIKYYSDNINENFIKNTGDTLMLLNELKEVRERLSELSERVSAIENK